MVRLSENSRKMSKQGGHFASCVLLRDGCKSKFTT